MRRYVLFGLAVFGALILSAQLSLDLPILGIGPDLIVMVVATFALGERPRSAAVAGFAAGLFRDLLLTAPKGLSAFAYALTAYAVAMLGVSRSAGAVVGTVIGATFASQVIYGLSAVLIGPQADVSPLPRVVLVTCAYNALVSPLLMPILRRVIQVDPTTAVGD